MRKTTTEWRDSRSHPFMNKDAGEAERHAEKGYSLMLEEADARRSYMNLRPRAVKKMNPLFQKCFITAVLVGSLLPRLKNDGTRRCDRTPILRKTRNLDRIKCEGWSDTLRHTYCAGTLEPSWLTTSKSAWVSERARSGLISMRSTRALRTFAAEQRELHYKLKGR